MTPKTFLAQVVWPRVQLPSVGGVTPLALVVMMTMLRTSLLLMELGNKGRHRIEAHFDQEFSLFLFYFILFFDIYDNLISMV